MAHLNGCVLKEGKAKWGWANDKGEVFSAGLVRKELQSARLTQYNGQEYKWNPWAPAKANYFVWRAQDGLIPTRTTLVRQGVQMQDTRCPACSAAMECSDHLLVSCGLANHVWTHICLWLRIPMYTSLESVAEVVNYITAAGTSERHKRLMNLVATTTLWRIWSARNDRVFNNKPIQMEAVFDEVKEITILWLSMRSKEDCRAWDLWNSPAASV
ncbi:uncharacterized protein LOC110943677 [Helianthus annuus]|uniref:uncharacterized protein LOC110943677 n=1 Tax=Helianthus annuus TaxID=4232 RepID=UPI000B907857|nr:uncharacterized protein LOC110943677 [Helianthus annuus]